MEVQISKDLKVFLKEKLTRKTQKEFNKIIFKNAKTNQDGKVEINLSDVDDANDVLLINMIEKVILKDKEQVIDINFLDNLEQIDYEKILLKCKELRENADETKKK